MRAYLSFFLKAFLVGYYLYQEPEPEQWDCGEDYPLAISVLIKPY